MNLLFDPFTVATFPDLFTLMWVGGILISIGAIVVYNMAQRRYRRYPELLALHEWIFWPIMLVAGVIEIGLIDAVASVIVSITGGALAGTTLLILWLSAVLSGLIDNIPYTATMIPVVERLAEGQPNDAIWWALAIGADLGGNATIIGASANVILAGMAGREGHPISFGAFLRYGLPVTAGSMVIATAYVWLRYLL